MIWNWRIVHDFWIYNFVFFAFCLLFQSLCVIVFFCFVLWQIRIQSNYRKNVPKWVSFLHLFHRKGLERNHSKNDKKNITKMWYSVRKDGLKSFFNYLMYRFSTRRTSFVWAFCVIAFSLYIKICCYEFLSRCFVVFKLRKNWIRRNPYDMNKKGRLVGSKKKKKERV